MSEKSILAAMAYVDLNPICANVAKRLRISKHTSIRVRCIKIEGQPKATQQVLQPLLGCQSYSTPTLTQADYIKVVDFTGRQFAKGKKGRINAAEQCAFDKLGLNPAHWVHRVKAFGPNFGARWFRFVGELEDFVEKIPEFKKRTLFSKGMAAKFQKG